MRKVARCGVLATLVVAITGFGALPASAKNIPAPDGLPAFYSVPKPLPSTNPGALIKSQKIAAPDIDGTVYRIMYVTKSQRGKAIPVTGVVIVPDGHAPKGGWPVLAWAHGTNGMADECAASLDVDSAARAANKLLGEGWLVVATDYQGEGTPGLHPYIAGDSSARDTLDSVRAAGNLRGADASRDYVVWGHSQGGHTAMFALKDAAEYAPELRLHGVVAGAPPSQFNLIYDFLKTSPFKRYLLMAAGGLNAAYGDKVAPLDKVLTPKGIDLLPLLDEGCSDFVDEQTEGIAFDEVTNGNPFDVPEWRELLEANDPQQFTDPVDVPLLMIQGGADEQIPPVSTQILAEHLCDIGQDLERWIYPGATHSGVIAPSLADMIHWISDRFTGDAEPRTYAPVGQADVEITRCPR